MVKLIRFLGRWLLFFSLPFVLGKSAFSVEECVRESLHFADCVDSSIVQNAGSMAKDQLEEQVVKSCAVEKKQYEACGQFDKASFSADFIKVRIELFTKDNAKAFAGTPAPVDPSTN